MVATNALALFPVWRERQAPFDHIPMVVCTPHLNGGYGNDDRLHLFIYPDTDGPIGGLDAAGLAELGFAGSDIARLNDTSRMFRGTAQPRRAWVRLEQRADSGRRWRAVAVGPTRAAVAGSGLLVRAFVGMGYESVHEGTLRLVPQIVEARSMTIHFDSRQSAAYRALRLGNERCSAVPITLSNGVDGRVWLRTDR